QELLTQQQRVARNPALAAGPALHIGRIEGDLAQAYQRAQHLRLRQSRHAENVNGPNHEVDRRLDQRTTIARIAEVSRFEQGPQERPDFIVLLPEKIGQARHFAVVRGQRHELAPQLPDDGHGGLRVRQQGVQDVVAIEVSGLAEHRLLAAVVLVDAYRELAVLIDAPSRERTGRLLDVRLAVVPLAEVEQLQELASEILIGLTGHRPRPVEIDQHRRI